ncbi:hypothetical protein F5141DRAFT_1185604 [Pisolithus sp. B1]|nr:hypothetical protein F5141DRAFT_1185604 [Pisolithus sp. B1]
MTTPDRQDLVRNAVAFLSDTQQAPLAQRVQFLEAKGLTGPEIEEAMRQAANKTPPPQPSLQTQPYSVLYGPSPYNTLQPQPWDWRDYFITAVISGTVVYGAVSLFKKYLAPHLKPPAATAYEQDRDALTAQFDAAEALLREIQDETASVRAAVEEQREKVDKATKDVESVVVEMREGEARTRDEMREIRDEVENIREMLPKMIENNKEAQKQSLLELQQELKSLKALLLSRGGTLSSTPSTPLPALAGKPSIPSWQLSGASPTPSSEPVAASGIRPRSPDVNTSRSSSQLAESALLNLRKSLATQRASAALPQRSASPQSRSGSPQPPSVPKSSSDTSLRKSTLEERLRASFTIGESLSGTTSNAPSSRASPGFDPPHAPHNTLSPETVSLPESPTQVASGLPTEEHTIPVPHSQSPPPISLENKDPSTLDSEVQDVTASLDVHDQLPVVESPSGNTSGDVTQGPTLERGDECPSILTTSAVSDSNNITVNTGLTPEDPEVSPASHESPASDIPQFTDSEALQERLKLVEQRFTDMSTSFKKLQAERLAVDALVRELTPLEDIRNVAALRDYLSNMNMKLELSQDELQRLGGKLTRQEERIEELRDVHRLEIASHLDQVEKLKQQLAEAEALISASQASASQTEEEGVKKKTEIAQLSAEVSKAREIANEEEEKRVKAVSLLKTVRQKLVKAEKDRDDAVKELNEVKEQERHEREKAKSERVRLESEIDSVNLEREKVVTGLRAQFDKELAAVSDRAEREISSARMQFTAEFDRLKVTRLLQIAVLFTDQARSAKESHISTLEKSVNNLSNENRSFFDQLQLRQAELESSQLHAESLQSQNTELQFQLRAVQERVALLTDELGDLRSEHESRLQGCSASTEDVSLLINSVETKYEAKISELRRTMAAAERERTESEANWSKKLLLKAREADELRSLLQSSTRTREQEEDVVESLKAVIERLKGEAQLQQRHLSELQSLVEQMKANEATLQSHLSEIRAQADEHRKQADESKARESQLRTHNKTLREELRKVQSSVTLMERQRNPGVGYWSSRTGVADSRTSVSSPSDTPSRAVSPELQMAATTAKSDEDINYEYLRNVILQFLEHKEMRPSLVRVLSTILRFTPQETRRLVAKV